MPTEPEATGPDLARAALARARADARARGAQPDRSGGGTGRRGRRPQPGDEERRSGAAPDERDPQRLAAAVERLVRERGWEHEAAAGGLVGRWREIVGSDLAEHVVPEAYEPGEGGGLLRLRAESTAWATQVRLLLPEVRRRIEAELGRGVVARIQVVGPAAPRWDKGPRTVRGRGPRDTYG